MNKKACISLIVRMSLLVWLLSPSMLWACADSSIQVQVANLNQDLYALKQQVGQLRLKTESLERENAQLKQYIAQLNQRASVSPQELQSIRKELLEEGRRQKESIVGLVTEQINHLANQTQLALQQSITGKNASPSKTTKSFTFTDDYPKEGVAYTVQKGDTLGEIALQHNSTVKDIQNANRLANPKDLRAGQTIFIPQNI